MCPTEAMRARSQKEMNAIKFPPYSGTRCLMMPYLQGEPESVSDAYASYRDIVSSIFIRKGDVGFLTIDESPATAGKPHRGQRARYPRALHTEAGIVRGVYGWGDVPTWGGKRNVTLDRDVRILVASNVTESCAVWDAEHEDTSADGDIGHVASEYPYRDAVLLKKGEVREIGILTPHESLPVRRSVRRQFLRIVSSGVHGREDYFTENPLVPIGG
jgi:hypothetical protein